MNQLKTIWKQYWYSVDISNELGYKKSSISVAMKNLRENNYITMSDAGFISLTDSGKEIAEITGLTETYDGNGNHFKSIYRSEAKRYKKENR